MKLLSGYLPSAHYIYHRAEILTIISLVFGRNDVFIKSFRFLLTFSKHLILIFLLLLTKTAQKTELGKLNRAALSVNGGGKVMVALVGLRLPWTALRATTGSVCHITQSLLKLGLFKKYEFNAKVESIWVFSGKRLWDLLTKL